MARKAFIRGEPGQKQFGVGCHDKATDYHGPFAFITFDKDWLWISTDDYEGTAMLNIEALPMLRRALAYVAHYQRTHAD
jgi:hypothetical protein